MSEEMYAKKITEYQNAIITPTRLNRKKNSFCGCVYDHSGAIVKESQRASTRVSWVVSDPDTVPASDVEELIKGRCLYMGHYSGQYGHFLLETLSRFWIFETKPRYDFILFNPFIHRTPEPTDFSPAKTIFSCFSIDEKKFKLVDRKARIDCLVLPSHLIDINTLQRANPEQIHVYKEITTFCNLISAGTNKYSKIYLSRKNWRFCGLAKNPFLSCLIKGIAPVLRFANISMQSIMNRPVINEAEIEELFSLLGFTVVYPEKLSFVEQVSLYSNADVMAGFVGSAMHNSVFMRKGATVINIGSCRGLSNNQRLCDLLSKVDSHFIEFKGRIVDKSINSIEFDVDYLSEEIHKMLK